MTFYPNPEHIKKLVQKELENQVNVQQRQSEQLSLGNNFGIENNALNMRIYGNESSAVALLLKMLNLAPSQKDFEEILLPWLRQKIPYISQVYESNKPFFDVMAPKIVGAATIGVGLYKLKNYLSTYFGFSAPPPGTRKRGRPRKYEYVEQ
jgi:hypothetical protein